MVTRALEVWNRKLHYYLGLYFLFFLWLFSLTGLMLNHQQWFTDLYDRHEVSYDPEIRTPFGDHASRADLRCDAPAEPAGEVDWPAAQPVGHIDFNVAGRTAPRGCASTSMRSRRTSRNSRTAIFTRSRFSTHSAVRDSINPTATRLGRDRHLGVRDGRPRGWADRDGARQLLHVVAAQKAQVTWTDRARGWVRDLRNLRGGHTVTARQRARTRTILISAGSPILPVEERLVHATRTLPSTVATTGLDADSSVLGICGLALRRSHTLLGRFTSKTHPPAMMPSEMSCASVKGPAMCRFTRTSSIRNRSVPARIR